MGCNASTATQVEHKSQPNQQQQPKGKEETKAKREEMSDCPVVKTDLGRVRGQVLEKPDGSDAKPVYCYGCIPFAKPPLGDLRFEPPQKVEKWNGVLDGTKFPPNPAQDEVMANEVFETMVTMKVGGQKFEVYDEDCLYLSVYTPNTDKTANLPVLFWIYGGGYVLGGSIFFNGQVLCGLKDVVLVTPNYRVNAFGFLDMGQDTKWTGNMGLKDQVMALEWTRDHIANFGGDPNNVTIFGESAGGISVGLHVLSPLSRGLFHKAIGNSGVANHRPLLREDHTLARKSMFGKLGITETEPEEIMRKLKKFSTKEIVQAQDIASYMYFGVAVGDEFLPKLPEVLYTEGDFAPVPYLMGCNSTEGYGLCTHHLPPGFDTGYNEEMGTQIAKGMLGLSVPPDKLQQAVEIVKRKFASIFKEDDTMRWSKIVGSVMAELWFVAPMIEQASVHAGQGHKTFVYYMTQQLRCNHDDTLRGTAPKKIDCCQADHGDDILFTFGIPQGRGDLCPKVTFTDEEKRLSLQWMDYLVNFARNGDPNIGVPMQVEWPRYDDQKRHIVFREPFEVDSDLLADRYNLWTKVIPSL